MKSEVPFLQWGFPVPFDPKSSDTEPILRQRETYKHGAAWPQRHRSHSACGNHRFSHLLLLGDCRDGFWLQRFDAVLIESWSVCQSLSTWHAIMQWADRSLHGCKEHVQLVWAVFVFALAKLKQKLVPWYLQAQVWQECSLLRLLCSIFLRFHPARCWMHWALEPQRQSLAAWQHLAVGFILLDRRTTPTIQLVLSWWHWADLPFLIARWVLETWQQVQRCDNLPKTSKNNSTTYDFTSTLNIISRGTNCSRIYSFIDNFSYFVYIYIYNIVYSISSSAIFALCFEVSKWSSCFPFLAGPRFHSLNWSLERQEGWDILTIQYNTIHTVQYIQHEWVVDAGLERWWGAEIQFLNFGRTWTAPGQGNFFPAHAGLITACLVGSFDASSGDFAILARLGQILRIQVLFFFVRNLQICGDGASWFLSILSWSCLSLWTLQCSHRDE